MDAPFPEFDPDARKVEREEEQPHSGRLRDVSFRVLVPNLITLGAICSGLTGIRLADEGRFELAVVAVVFAALLDGLDGRVARFLKSATPFGAQLDSLADFVNFGVAPAMVLYLWVLKDLHSFGWLVALAFAICGCLRLARFNVMLDDPNKPGWSAHFFTGIPAPAGALLALMPVYLGLLGVERSPVVAALSAVYLLAIAFLMVSSLPTWSGKQVGKRVSSRLVLPVMIGIVMLIVLLFSYPWLFLTGSGVIYLATLPLSYRSYRKFAAADAKEAAAEST